MRLPIRAGLASNLMNLDHVPIGIIKRFVAIPQPPSLPNRKSNTILLRWASDTLGRLYGRLYGLAQVGSRYGQCETPHSESFSARWVWICPSDTNTSPSYPCSSRELVGPGFRFSVQEYHGRNDSYRRRYSSRD